MATLLPVLLTACGGEYPEVGTSAAAIVRGSLDLHHSTVGLLEGGAMGTCTGTLVGQHSVLTAAHCVTGTTAETLRFTLNGEVYAVQSALAHPQFKIESATVYHDVAVLILAADALNDMVSAEPIPLANVEAISGTQLEVVGMGQTDDPKDTGLSKRTAVNVIGRVDPWIYSLTAPDAAAGGLGSFCRGDSGGPSFATVQGKKVQVGVHSFLAGDDETACTSAEGYDFRVDSHLAFIESAAVGDVVTAKLGAFPAGAVPASTSDSETIDATRNEFRAVGCSTGGSRPTPTSALILLALAALIQRRRSRR